MSTGGLDARGNLHRDLGTTITQVLGYAETLYGEAQELGQEMYLPDLLKIQSTVRQLNTLIQELVGEAVQRLEDVDFPRLRFEVRTALNHTVGYSEMLRERSVELHQSGFVRDLDRILDACGQLLTLAESPPSSPAVALPVEEESESGTPEARSLGTLLVVDDNIQSREHLSRLLRRFGYRVVQAGSGPSAMERIRAETFDLILLDVVMPGMNGYEVVQWLKADAQFRAVPVLMIATLNDTENVVRCMAVGAEDYVAKPFDPILLKARVGVSLERRRWQHKEAAYRRELAEEQAHSERLLLTILPKPIADRLRQGEGTIADQLADVTVLFADLVSFTPQLESLSPCDTVRLLNDIFTVFDLLADEYRVETLRTDGTAYFAVAGLPYDQRDHARLSANLALAMQQAMVSLREKNQRPLHLRIGLHTGPATAGIIGLHKICHDLWGETVDRTRALEASCEPDRIHVSAEFRALLEAHYRFEERPHNTHYLLAAGM